MSFDDHSVMFPHHARTRVLATESSSTSNAVNEVLKVWFVYYSVKNGHINTNGLPHNAATNVQQKIMNEKRTEVDDTSTKQSLACDVPPHPVPTTTDGGGDERRAA
mgnify:CR=1 FL=1